jgi:hypothetical protein
MKRLHKNDFLKALKLKRKIIEHVKKLTFTNMVVKILM